MITRRSFGKAAGAVSVAALAQAILPSCGTTATGTSSSAMNPYKKDLGIQLWTVRNELAADPVNTLTAIRKAGYKHIELQGSDDITVMKPMADDEGLQIHSAHFPGAYITERWDLNGQDKAPISRRKMLENYANAGVSNLVMAYLKKEERAEIDNYKRVAERMNEFGEECIEAGIQLSYHNHSFEWAAKPEGIGWKILVNDLDPELAKFELDVYWASVANRDPIKIMDQLKSRIHLLHLKDKKTGTLPFFDEAIAPPDSFKELGAGELNFETITAKAVQYGIEYCMVEQDQSPDPLQSIKQSIDYYKKIG